MQAFFYLTLHGLKCPYPHQCHTLLSHDEVLRFLQKILCAFDKYVSSLAYVRKAAISNLSPATIKSWGPSTKHIKKAVKALFRGENIWTVSLKPRNQKAVYGYLVKTLKLKANTAKQVITADGIARGRPLFRGSLYARFGVRTFYLSSIPCSSDS